MRLHLLPFFGVLICLSGCPINEDHRCTFVDCSAVPPVCSGDVLAGALPGGSCDPDSGLCVTPAIHIEDRDCAAEGLICRDGDCVSPPDLCAGVVCESSDAYCEGDFLHGAVREACVEETGICEPVGPSQASQDCSEQGQICESGRCVDPPDLCAGVNCPSREAFCDGNMAHGASHAVCNPDTGECDDTPGAPPRNCEAEGLVCLDGDCVESDDRCTDVLCPSHDAFCDGNLAHGARQDACNPETGECMPTPGAPPRDCSRDGLICVDGDCVEAAGLGLCGDVALPNDGFGVVGPRLEGRLLVVPVSYSGGCEDHEFPVCFDEFMEGGNNLRVQINIGHNGNGDRCEAELSQDLNIDLEPLILRWEEQPNHGDSLDITVTNFRGVLTYHQP